MSCNPELVHAEKRRGHHRRLRSLHETIPGRYLANRYGGPDATNHVVYVVIIGMPADATLDQAGALRNVYIYLRTGMGRMKYTLWPLLGIQDRFPCLPSALPLTFDGDVLDNELSIVWRQ